MLHEIPAPLFVAAKAQFESVIQRYGRQLNTEGWKAPASEPHHRLSVHGPEGDRQVTEFLRAAHFLENRVTPCPHLDQWMQRPISNSVIIDEGVFRCDTCQEVSPHTLKKI